MIAHSFLRILATCGLLAGSTPTWAAFSCPVQDAAPGGDALDLGAMPLSSNSPDLPQSVFDAIGRMRRDNVSNGRIVDALVPRYCKRVEAESGLSDVAKSAAIERFASRVAKYLYRTPSSDEEDILVDVPVPEATFDALRRAAKTEQVSQDAWVNAAIRAKLDKP